MRHNLFAKDSRKGKKIYGQLFPFSVLGPLYMPVSYLKGPDNSSGLITYKLQLAFCINAWCYVREAYKNKLHCCF